jgi:gamma-glutamyl-gamma-aminobutyrate hydrolase PuuD
VIGLTTYAERAQCGVWDTEFALLPRNYVEMVSEAGGVPVLLPPVDLGAAEIVASLDGLVLSGGADIDPARYGQARHPETTGSHAGRDDWEVRLLEEALPRDLPVLGVCRGLQVLNVGLGGSLTQHLPDAVGHTAHRPAPATFGTSSVRLRKGSRTAGILGAECVVHCHHHQAIDRVASALDVVGWASDGTIEAVEMRASRFVLAVQWHPEEDPTDRRLFAALLDAARQHDPAGGAADRALA